MDDCGSRLEYYITATDERGQSTSQGFVGFPLVVRLVVGQGPTQEDRLKALQESLDVMRKGRKVPRRTRPHYQSLSLERDMTAMHVQESAKRAKDAALRLATLSTATKNRALEAIADALIEHREHILEANRHDVTQATRLVERGVLAKPLLDRLKLTEHKVLDMATGVRSVAGLPDPVGQTLSTIELDTGLVLTQVTCPIGVIGAILNRVRMLSRRLPPVLEVWQCGNHERRLGSAGIEPCARAAYS